MNILREFLSTTAVANLSAGNVIMILIGMIFIGLAIRKDYEPLLLLPIGFGAIVGNIPPIPGMAVGVLRRGQRPQLHLLWCQPGHFSAPGLPWDWRNDRLFNAAVEPASGLIGCRCAVRYLPDASWRALYWLHAE